jgi:hypothetical protein
MQINVQCDCGKSFTTKSENAGKKAKCGACGRTISIPTPSLDASVADWLHSPTTAVKGSRTSEAPASPPSTPPPVSISSLASSSIGPINGPPLAPTSTTISSGPGDRRTGDGVTNESKEELGFLDWNSSSLLGLFDWRFRDFITPSIVSSLYSCHIIIVGLALIALVCGNFWVFFNSLARGEPYFYYMLVLADLSVLLIVIAWTLVVRLCLEAVMVIFRAEESLRKISDRIR